LPFAHQHKASFIIPFTAGQSRKKGETVPYKPKSRSITGMEKAEIKSIGNYLKNLEEGI
jgi:hypothetical protein